MDIILRVSNDLFLDRLWANVLPVSAFVDPELLISVNSTSSLPLIASLSSSKWSQIVSYIPHPPLSEKLLSSATSSVPLASAWPRDYIPRQLISLFFLTLVGIHLMYFIIAYLSYKFIFNHDMMKHPRYLKNQIKLEIQQSLSSFPGMIILTLPWFQAEVMGYSKLYDDVGTYGWPYLIFSVFLYVLSSFSKCMHEILPTWIPSASWCLRTTASTGSIAGNTIPYATSGFTSRTTNGLVSLEFLITFCMDRRLTTCLLFTKRLVPTPFASHAFHPLDGYLQSIPYHVFIFLFPLHRQTYLGLFVFVNFWTILVNLLPVSHAMCFADAPVSFSRSMIQI